MTGEARRVAAENNLPGAGDPQISALVDSHTGSRITVGQRGEYELTGARRELEVREVRPEGANGRVRVSLRSLGEPPPDLASRQRIEIRLPLGPPSEVIRLARGAFFQRTGGQWVYVVDEADGKAVRRPVRLGRQNPDFFEVLSGLEPGMRVITSAYETFGDSECLILE